MVLQAEHETRGVAVGPQPGSQTRAVKPEVMGSKEEQKYEEEVKTGNCKQRVRVAHILEEVKMLEMAPNNN